MIDRRRTLFVLTKLPRVGRGKSRLAASIGNVSAWRINRALQALTMRRIADPRWRVVLAVDPPLAYRQTLPGVWPKRSPRVPQTPGSLGERIVGVLAHARGQAAVIGTDCPDVTRAAVASVFKALRGRRAAAGPATDGGFWMLAVQRAQDAIPIRRGVRWSHAQTLADVAARLGVLGQGPTLGDVDTVEDWRAFVRSQRSRGR